MRILLSAMLITCLMATGCFAKPSSVEKISNEQKAQTVRALQTTLHRYYVYQDKVENLTTLLDERLQSGAYRGAKTGQEFSNALTNDLIDISGDSHFAVIYDPEWIAISRDNTSENNSLALREDSISALQQSNFGFKDLEILEGNIGYIRFDYFPDPEHSFEAGAIAMKFVENADALIFDMRYNRGGHNQFAQFLTSYLFDSSKEQLLFEYAEVDEGETKVTGYMALPALPGARKPDMPVYVLTSSATYSAAEWFAYSLQKLDRATIVGRQTSGGSHPVERKAIDNRFLLQLPVGLLRDPVDKGDFEGMGVIPDHKVESNSALAHAHKLAFERISSGSVVALADYEWMLPVLKARISAPKVNASNLQELAGKYEGRQIELGDNGLTYHWRDRFSLALIPLEHNLFALEGVDDFRFRFAEENGRISALERVEKDGSVTTYPRR